MVKEHQPMQRKDGAKRASRGDPDPDADIPIESSEKASEVDHDRFPNWLRLRLLRVFGPTTWGSRAGWALFGEWVRNFCGSFTWVDHEGTAIVNGQLAFVSEPYYGLDHDFSCVKELAEKLGCELIISAESHHLPGKTIRLAFLPKADVWAHGHLANRNRK